MAENVMKSLLRRILAVPKGEPRSAQLRRVLRFFRWWLVTPFLAAYVLRQMRRAAKAAGLPRAPSIGTHWLLGAFEHIVWTCPRIPKTKNRPDLMPAYQVAAKETQAEGLFCMSFFHWLLPLYSNVVVVHDLELVRELLGKKSWELYRKGKSYRIATDLIGSRALLASPDCELWRWQRRLLSPSFRRHLFDSVLAPSVKRHVGEMCERWESLAAAQGQRPEVDLASEGLRLTLKVLGNFAFGYDFGSSDSGSSSSSEFALDEAFEVVLHRMTDFGRNPLLFATRLFPSFENMKYWRALKAIDQAALSSIDGRLAQAEVKQGDQSFGDDLLGHMLGASAADSAAGGHRMDRQLIAEYAQIR
ncbi:unnamed protein product [Polarella glacialis]|uniref:Cytochrome P450 n=1 Tax=Polarella glacialis TaxID=89957 RepID=A0A813DYG7_POLGL|nr:unnamed protein product [Polarella glacialis]